MDNTHGIDPDEIYGSTANWVAVALSSDASKMAAIELPGYVWLQSGGVWNRFEDNNIGIFGYDTWRDITISADGSTIAVVSDVIYIYLAGRWQRPPSAPYASWRGIAMSSDWQTMVAVARYENIWTSSGSSGLQWDEDQSSGSSDRKWVDWKDVAMSSDGWMIAAVGSYGAWTSSDGGATWVLGWKGTS